MPTATQKLFQPTTEHGRALITAIRDQADKHPDKIIAAGSCRYLTPETGDPECLVGCAMVEIGWLEKGLVNDGNICLSDSQNTTSIGALLASSHHEKFESMTYEERVWVAKAQRNQDQQDTWLSAVVGADRNIEWREHATLVSKEDYQR